MSEHNQSLRQKTTTRYLEFVEKIKRSRGQYKRSDEDIKKNLTEIILGVADEVRNKGSSNEELEEKIRNKTAVATNGWLGTFSHVEACYKTVHEDYLQLVNEKKQIAEIENETHRRNVLYRGLTTLTVGLIIMTVYAVAQYLEIQMPLMRLPMPT